MKQHQNQPLLFLNSLLPLKVHDVFSNIGSMFQIHCANDRAGEGSEKIQFWIYLSDWELLARGIKVLDSEQISDTNRDLLQNLVDYVLFKIEYSPENNRLVFSFEQDFTLSIWGNTTEYEPEDDMLIVYIDGIAALSCNPMKKFYWDNPTIEH